MKILGEKLPEEIARVRELIKLYAEIGPGGKFAIMLMEQALKKADEAMISGDIVEMVRVYQDLKAFE